MFWIATHSKSPPLSEASDDVLVAAVVANPDSHHNTITQAELYESGCIKHISLYWEDLTDFLIYHPKFSVLQKNRVLVQLVLEN